MTTPRKMLVAIMKEGDEWFGAPAYERFVHRLHQSGIAGATVTTGVMGFGRHHRIHHPGLFGVTDDRPITILAVDYEDRLRQVVAESRDILDGAVAMLLDVDVL